MAFLVRSLAVIAILLVAFVAFLNNSNDSGNSTFEGIRQLEGDVIAEIHDIFEEEETVEELVIDEHIANEDSLIEQNIIVAENEEGATEEQHAEEATDGFKASPDDYDFAAIEDREDLQKLEMLSHQLEEALMSTKMMETQAHYVQEMAKIEAQQEPTQEALETAEEVEQVASLVVEDAKVQEEEVLAEEEHILEEIENVGEVAVESRRRLMENLKTRDTKKVVLNGVAFEAEQ